MAFLTDLVGRLNSTEKEPNFSVGSKGRMKETTHSQEIESPDIRTISKKRKK